MPGRDGGADEHGAEEPHSSRPGRDKFRRALRVRVEGVSLAGRRSVVGQGLTRPTERIALREWDESCRWSMRGDSGEILRSANPSGARKARYAQDDRRGQRVKRVFVESPLMSEMRQGLELERLVLGLASGSALGLVVDLGPHPSEDEPGPAERIRRSWEAVKCAAMGPVVG